MILKDLKNLLSKSLLNIRGWSTPRKIVVIESDDWGSIRMPSKKVYDYFISEGYRLESRAFEKYDTLENEDDLKALFSVLKKYKDKYGNSPVFTANTVVANPDFNKILKSKFSTYYYEPFTNTYKRFPSSHNCIDIWNDGISSKVFFPQFHAREHYNIRKWINSLKCGSADDLLAFKYEMVGIPPKNDPEKGNQLQIALSINCDEDLQEQKKIIEDGLNLFYQIFGYRSESFIAPVYTWHSSLEEVLLNGGVKYIQGSKLQKCPDGQNGEIRLIRHCIGEKNKYGQTYLVRNVYFEPSTDLKKDWVKTCMKDITIAFKWNKPAIISSHRLNYVGGIVTENRENGLKQLDNLISEIIRKHPEVEFMTSVELGALIARDQVPSYVL